jgi:hypothetical protein
MIFSLTLLITKTFSAMPLRMSTLSISARSITILKIVVCFMLSVIMLNGMILR